MADTFLIVFLYRTAHEGILHVCEHGILYNEPVVIYNLKFVFIGKNEQKIFEFRVWFLEGFKRVSCMVPGRI